MKSINFKVTFLSDIVLQASSNTEGNVEVLDFIPGSNFLGMVARSYDAFENAFDIFHSGKVRFGDATLLVDNQKTYKVPFSYYKPKLGGDVENHHFIEKFEADKQLKQIRKGYITKDGKVVEPEYDYSQKSAYDTIKRKSKDSQMYGYKAIKVGTVWSFSLSYDDSIDAKDIETIVEKLEGKKQLGKSKSAQYGSVLIEQIESINEDIEDFEKLENVVVYLNSRLALFDENGMPTYEPTPKNMGLDSDAKIVWEKSQIRTISFSPYNSARKTKDYTRVVIEKGSVIVFDKLTKEDIKTLKNGVGAYLSEGFGEVLINPIFTKDAKPKYEKPTLTKSYHAGGNKDENLLSFLKSRKAKQENIFGVSNEAHKFIKDHKKLYKEVSKSQWGEIRSIANRPDTDESNIKEKIKSYIDHGVTKKRWEKGEKKLLEEIEKQQYKKEFVKLLAILMPKQKFEEQKDD